MKENNRIEKSKNVLALPRTVDEFTAFRSKLLLMGDLIKSRQFDKARLMREELAPIAASKSHDHYELGIHYKLLEAKLSIAENNADAAHAILQDISRNSLKNHPDMLFHYYAVYGSYYIFTEQYILAIESIDRAIELMKQLGQKEEGLYYNLSVCYTELGRPIQAIVEAETARRIVIEKFGSIHNSLFDLATAINYGKIGEHDRAEALLVKALDLIKNADDRHQTAMIYQALACVYGDNMKFNKAMDCFFMAANHYDEGSFGYANNLLDKSYFLIGAGDYGKAEPCVQEGLLVSRKYQDIHKLFEANACAMRVSTSMNAAEEDLRFIETATIPDLAAQGKLLRAIWYCDILAVYYGGAEKLDMEVKYLKLVRMYHKKILREAGS